MSTSESPTPNRRFRLGTDGRGDRADDAQKAFNYEIYDARFDALNGRLYKSAGGAARRQ